MVRVTDRPNMTIDVYCGRKATHLTFFQTELGFTDKNNPGLIHLNLHRKTYYAKTKRASG